MSAVKNIPSHINLGCSREDIGTHSNRKFAESTSVSRVDGPNRTQVCLRSGQSVGRTQDCYMFQEDDGDCFVGRTVAQLKFDADEFDVLFKNVIDIYNIKYKICDQTTINTIILKHLINHKNQL
jgi:hypothetical protein